MSSHQDQLFHRDYPGVAELRQLGPHLCVVVQDDIEGKFESGPSYSSFKRRKPGAVNLGHPAVNLR